MILSLFAWAWLASKFPDTFRKPYAHAELGLLLCIFAVATDMVDGWVARTFGWVTDTGKKLDPAADKVFGIAVGVAVPLELGFGPYFIPYIILFLPIAVSGWETSKLRSNGRIGGASPVAKLKTAVLMGAQILFVAGTVSTGRVREELIIVGLALLAVSAVLARMSLQQYRAHIR